MPIDPSIPLAGRPYDPYVGLNLGNMTQRFIGGNFDIQQAVAERDRQNQLRQLLGNMQPQGAQGQYDPNQLRKIMAINPQMGLQIGQQQQQAPLRALQLQSAQTQQQLNLAKLAQGTPQESEHIINASMSPYEAYLEALKDPKVSKQQAIEAGQRALDDSRGTLEKSGLVRPNVFANMPSKFDPDQFEAFIRQNRPAWATAHIPMTEAQRAEKEPPFVKEMRASGIDPNSPQGKKLMAARMARETAPTATQISLSGVGQLNPDALTLAVDQYLAGDTSAGQGYARNAAMKSQFMNRLAQRAAELGMTGAEVSARVAEFRGTKARERTLGIRSAQIEMAVTEAQNLAPLALSASNAVNRTNYPNLNSIILAGEQKTGDENVVRLGIATNSLINVYARAVSPTGAPTVDDKQHARELLSGAWSKGQYQAGIDQLMKEMHAARKSPGQVREELRGAITLTTIRQEAPAAAIEHLKTDPELKDAFKAKYGYLP